MEILINTIQTTLNSFDFSYCIVVNILTYIIIKLVYEKYNKVLTTWGKRKVLLGVILVIGAAYVFISTDPKTIINSAIITPVFWSWIMKPICKYFNLDYKKIDTFEET